MGKYFIAVLYVIITVMLYYSILLFIVLLCTTSQVWPAGLEVLTLALGDVYFKRRCFIYLNLRYHLQEGTYNHKLLNQQIYIMTLQYLMNSTSSIKITKMRNISTVLSAFENTKFLNLLDGTLCGTVLFCSGYRL